MHVISFIEVIQPTGEVFKFPLIEKKPSYFWEIVVGLGITIVIAWWSAIY